MQNLLQNLNHKKSPNFTVDPNFKPTVTVIHCTRGGYQGAIDWLCIPPEQRPDGTSSSAHFVVGKGYGQVTQLVDIKNQSWHAGRVNTPTWRARQYMKRKMGVPAIVPIPNSQYINPNSYSIGIELELLTGETSKSITNWQYDCVVALIKQYNLPKTILMHKEITADKSDFANADGSYDMLPVQEVIRRLTKSN